VYVIETALSRRQSTARAMFREPCCWWPIGHLRGWKHHETGFGSKTTWSDVLEDCDDVLKFRRKCVVITGATSGIGLETLRAFAQTGATIILGARDEDRARAIACDVMTHSRAIVRVLPLDLRSLNSVRAFASSLVDLNIGIDVLINNAGLMPCEFDKVNARDLMFHVNFLAHFTLTQSLLRSRAFAEDARIVNVTSQVYMFSYPGGIRFDTIDEKRGYDAVKSYGQSKLALILWTNVQNKILQQEGRNIACFAVHPGSIKTSGSDAARKSASGWRGALLHCIGAPFVKSLQAGAATTVFAACHPLALHYLRDEGLSFFANCNPRRLTSAAQSPALAQKLYDYAVTQCARP
jgi:WW domain-containing oxidoreductase